MKKNAMNDFKHPKILISEYALNRNSKEELEKLKKEYEISNIQINTEIENETKFKIFNKWFRVSLFSNYFQWFIVMLAFVNLFLSLADLFIVPKNQEDLNLIKIFDYINIAIFSFFVLDSILRCLYLGVKYFIHSFFNVLDLIVIIICLIFDVLSLFSPILGIRIINYLLVNFRVWYAMRMIFKIQGQKLFLEQVEYSRKEEYYTKLVENIVDTKKINDELEKSLSIAKILIETYTKEMKENEDALLSKNKTSWQTIVPPNAPIKFRKSPSSSFRQLSLYTK